MIVKISICFLWFPLFTSRFFHFVEQNPFLRCCQGFHLFSSKNSLSILHTYRLPLFSGYSLWFLLPSILTVNLASSIYMSTWKLPANDMVSPYLPKLYWTLKVCFKYQILHLVVWGTKQCWSLPQHCSFNHTTWVSTRCVTLPQLETYDLPPAGNTELGTKQAFKKHLDTNGYGKIRNEDTLKKLLCICILTQQCLWSP